MAAVKAVNSRKAAGKGVEGEAVKEEQARCFPGRRNRRRLDLALPAPTRAAVLRTITKRGPEQIVEVIAACLVDRLRLLNDLFKPRLVFRRHEARRRDLMLCLDETPWSRAPASKRYSCAPKRQEHRLAVGRSSD
jgi:hypothetical protein